MSRDVLDTYAKQAKKEGYPARSVYKLKELQEKFNLFSSKSKVLDLGCSPGSWSEFVLRKLRGGFLVGIDLNPVKISYNEKIALFIEGDIKDNLSFLKEKGPFDAVISDAAPKTTGNRIVDTGRSLELVEYIIEIAFETLKKKGNFVVKVFQGGDEKELENSLKPYFESVKRMRPKAVRKESFETYLIGLGFKGGEEAL